MAQVQTQAENRDMLVRLLEGRVTMDSSRHPHVQKHLEPNPEEHRCRFQALAFTTAGRPFAYAKQLLYQAKRWLWPKEFGLEEMLEQVVKEAFIDGLPSRTSAWVQLHRPTTLSAANPNGRLPGIY